MNTLVRVCAATYDKTPVEQEGIRVLVSPCGLYLLGSLAGILGNISHVFISAKGKWLQV